MIHDHNKIIINIGQMIKLQRLKQIENYESIILNHCYVDIELILNKTYGHDNLTMINLSPTLVGKISLSDRVQCLILFYQLVECSQN
jgi:hypothetical protein